MGGQVPGWAAGPHAGGGQAARLGGRPRPGFAPVAVVGLACRFPGAADVEAFWRLLCRGADAVAEAPASRRDAWATAGADKFRRGGFLEQVDQFDPLFFGISPREAVQIDPQQRLALELAWESLEDAGLPASSLAGREAGVFWGCMWSDYARLLCGKPGRVTQHTALGQDSGVIAARVSYALGLRGPSLVVNTASSSSLVAVHLACQSLRLGESEVAVAGGVNLLLSPESTLTMARLGALSQAGRSRPFAEGADGYVRGEGGGAVVLKPLERALEDGDRVYCVIRASAVNHDGGSNGMAAPNPQAQRALLGRAYEQAGAEPAAVDFVEAHGTGTPLGDAAEAEALGAALGRAEGRGRPLLVGSVKSNLGHLEAAAGIAGLIKVALSISRRAIPPTINCEHPSRHIPFEDLRLKVQTTLGPWPDEARPALAGVSSFGYGGTNCHVVLAGLQEEHDGEPRPSNAPGVTASDEAAGAELFTLSAHTPQALRELARATASHVAEHAGVSLRDLCYTAAVRRSHHAHRAAFVSSSKEELVAQLSRFAQAGAGGVAADARPHPEAGSEEARGPEGGRDARLASLGARYVGGQVVEWGALYPRGGRCVRLPPYPWQRQRYWLEDAPAQKATPEPAHTSAAEIVAHGPSSNGKSAPPSAEPSGPTTEAPAPAESLRETLHAAGAAGRRPLVEAYLREQVSKLLMLPAGELDFRQPLLRLGFDSLMALELESRLGADLRVEVPLDTLFQNLSTAGLADQLLERLAAEGEAGPGGARRAEGEWEVFKI